MLIRKVHINCRDIDQARQATDGKVDEAIGYLVCWAIGSKSHVDVILTVANDHDVSATYTNAEGKATYYIQGVWHEAEKRYSFHS